jgi:hypothetical protein
MFLAVVKRVAYGHANDDNLRAESGFASQNVFSTGGIVSTNKNSSANRAAGRRRLPYTAITSYLRESAQSMEKSGCGRWPLCALCEPPAASALKD